MGQSTEELSNDIAGTRQNLASDLDALQDRVSPQAIVDRRKAAVRGRVSSMKDKVMGSGHSTSSNVSGSVTGAKDQAADQLGNAGHAVEQQVQGSPLGAGLVAFGAGLVVAGLIPATRVESNVAQKATELAQEHGQPLKDEAASAAREMGDNLKEAGTKAADEVKTTAQDSASRVQEKSPVGGSGSDPGTSPTY